MVYSRTRIRWTDEDWAAHGYVLVNVKDGGVVDPVYVKREKRFMRSSVITLHEQKELRERARKIHLNNKKRRAKKTEEYRKRNEEAMLVYKKYAEERRVEERKRNVREGKIPLDEMTFFDLIDDV